MTSLRSHAATEQDAAAPEGDDAAGAASADATADGALPLDTAFDVLENARRRHVLRLVLTAEEGTTLGDVAEHIAARENDKPREEIEAQERKRVYVGLYQCHLPQLDDVGVVAFDEETGTIEAGPHAEELARYLETATGAEPTPAWPRATLLAGAGGIGLGAALALAAPQVAPIVVAVVLAGIGLALLVGAEDRLPGVAATLLERLADR